MYGRVARPKRLRGQKRLRLCGKAVLAPQVGLLGACVPRYVPIHEAEHQPSRYVHTYIRIEFIGIKRHGTFPFLIVGTAHVPLGVFCSPIPKLSDFIAFLYNLVFYCRI